MQILHGFFIDEPQDIVYDRTRILIEPGGLNMLLPHEKNDIAVVGFAISAVSIPLVALGVLCLFGVICNPVIGFFFIAPAIIASVNGIIYSAIGHHRVCERAFHGGAFSVAGLVIGSSMLSLSLGALVQLILTVVR